MRPTQTVHATALGLQLETWVPGADGGWGQEHGVWGANPGRGLPLAASRRQPEGSEVRKPTSMFVEGHCYVSEGEVPLHPLSPLLPLSSN